MRKFIKVVIITALVLIGGFGLCLAYGAWFETTAPTPTRVPTPSTLLVEYNVETKHGGKASLTYNNAYGDTEQIGEAKTPWSRTYQMPRGTFLYISAQNLGVGSITCNIKVNGKTVRESTSEGKYTIATCSGRFK